jgi:hypothetical protein
MHNQNITKLIQPTPTGPTDQEAYLVSKKRVLATLNLIHQNRSIPI